MRQVSPQVEEITHRHAHRTVFTRFITPERPEHMSGMWLAYYEKWRTMTREQLDPGLLDIVPTLKHFIPPARVFDKLTMARLFKPSSMNSSSLTR
ncbi:hypothetical protein EV286_11792 [Rhizobium sp. BK251]|nr:hypothetical protein EV286_11792 [Rhizobium sp. BK251]